MERQSFSDAHVISQKRATKALIKFCEDHGYDVDGVEDLRACLKSLEQANIESAVSAYLRIPIGGMGRFDDWLPPTAFDHETPEYSRAVFEALVTQWSLLMKLSLPSGD